MVLGDWGHTPTSGKGILYVQMQCLPISDIYVGRVEFYCEICKRVLKDDEFTAGE